MRSRTQLLDTAEIRAILYRYGVRRSQAAGRQTAGLGGYLG